MPKLSSIFHSITSSLNSSHKTYLSNFLPVFYPPDALSPSDLFFVLLSRSIDILFYQISHPSDTLSSSVHLRCHSSCMFVSSALDIFVFDIFRPSNFLDVLYHLSLYFPIYFSKFLLHLDAQLDKRHDLNFFWLNIKIIINPGRY